MQDTSLKQNVLSYMIKNHQQAQQISKVCSEYDRVLKPRF